MEKMIKIDGMHCRSCEILICDSVSAIEGVSGAAADAKNGTLRVVVSDEKTLEEVKKAVANEGYRVVQ